MIVFYGFNIRAFFKIGVIFLYGYGKVVICYYFKSIYIEFFVGLGIMYFSCGSYSLFILLGYIFYLVWGKVVLIVKFYFFYIGYV